MSRECKLAGNRFSEFPLELANLPNLHLLDLSLNQVGGLILTLVMVIFQICSLPEEGLDQLTVVDLNLNENQVLLPYPIISRSKVNIFTHL